MKQRSNIQQLVTAVKAESKQLKKATALYLTEQAIETRLEAGREIGRSMTIRNKRFVLGRLRFHRASPSHAPDRQFSTAGSIASPRFSGWKEQQTGGQLDRTAATTAGRGGTSSKQIPGRHRLKRGSAFPSPAAIPGRFASRAHRAHVHMRMMSRARKKPFVLSGHRKLPAGIYTLDGKHGPRQWPRPRLLRAFGPRPKVEKNPWMERTNDRQARAWNPLARWADAWSQAGMKRKGRRG